MFSSVRQLPRQSSRGFRRATPTLRRAASSAYPNDSGSSSSSSRANRTAGSVGFKGFGIAAVGAVGVVGTYLITVQKDTVRLDAKANDKKGVTVAELQKHVNTETGIWVEVNGQVYDLTDFMPAHPGGGKILLAYAGKNSSKVFNKYHAPDFPDKFLPPEKHLGPLIGELEPAADITEGPGAEEREKYKANLPDLSFIFTLSDFEYIAHKILPPTAWYYYSSAAENEVTLRENHNAYGRIFFKPRVLVDLEEVDLSTTMLGTKTSVPFYCSAAAQAKLGHEDGELSIARGCGKADVIQMISTYASYPFDEIAGQVPGQTQWFQLYVGSDKAATAQLIKNATEKKMQGIFVTVDTAELGRREKDLKTRAELGFADDKGDDDLSSSVQYGVDHSVRWHDIDEFRKLTDVPIVLKGVQSVEDVVLAAEKGIKAVVLSNHGGRQLDFSRAPIEVLADAMPVLKERGLDQKTEIYIDGGVRRGSDILKALALGAKGVGLGRMFLYANSCYGEAGVRQLIQMLKAEMALNMKLLGVSRIDQLRPELLDTRNLHSRHGVSDISYYRNYEPLSPPKFKHGVDVRDDSNSPGGEGAESQ